VPLERLSRGLRPADDDLQPFQPLELERSLGPDLRGTGGPGGDSRGPEYRQHCGQGASLGSWRKRGAKAQAIGRSRGGPTTKIHALTDACGRIAAFSLTPGNVADISAAPALLAAIPAPRRLIADKGYDANSLRRMLAQFRTEAVIPSTRSRRRPIPYDMIAYRERNRIERAFCSLKDWRRLATRYDKLARNFLSAVALAAVILWWT
jgi:transposase